VPLIPSPVVGVARALVVLIVRVHSSSLSCYIDFSLRFRLCTVGGSTSHLAVAGHAPLVVSCPLAILGLVVTLARLPIVHGRVI